MNPVHSELSTRVPPASILGWLNFADGRPDARFEKALNDLFAALLERGEAEPMEAARTWLESQCDTLAESGQAAFKDLTQARQVLRLAFVRFPAAWLAFHKDLLRHQTPAFVFNSFLMARACEAVLSEGGPWTEEARILSGTIARLNDYVGYRPIPVFETRPQTDLYPHEKIRPVPLYIRGVGVAAGPYSSLVGGALEILRTLDPDLLAQSSFDLARLDELAVDPRAYDHNHPVNRRPNYLFGEWDPHLLDSKGMYRRFVVRQCVLDAMMQKPRESQNPEVLTEASAVLAGTILMASGFSGEGPTWHDSDVKLGNLAPKIARYRDMYYQKLLDTLPERHQKRLREEAKKLRQPFGTARQYLNHELARQRATQLQERCLALIFAELGYPKAAREHANRIQTTSVRIVSEIILQQTAAAQAIENRTISAAIGHLDEVEKMLRRGINCGAIMDPWNMLGYQGLFPLFAAKEDSTRDTRIEELTDTVASQLELYSRLIAVIASAGDKDLRKEVTRSMRSFAQWWDQYATADVSDVPRVHGGERTEAAIHVSKALARWEKRFGSPGPEGRNISAELAFWREQREAFHSAKAYSQVVEALIRQRDWHASLGLMMAWLSEAPQISLDDEEVSFFPHAENWIDGVLADVDGEARGELVRRFFVMLEANANEYWQVPDPFGTGPRSGDSGDTFSSAYENMVFKDSADDGNDGPLMGNRGGDFSLEGQDVELEIRLNFIETAARLWRTAIRQGLWATDPPEEIAAWHDRTREWEDGLRQLMNDLHAVEVPPPVGGLEDAVEFDRRRAIREHLVDMAIGACVEVIRAGRAMLAITGPASADGDNWQAQSIHLEQALTTLNPEGVRRRLPQFLEAFKGETLLFVPLSDGGKPERILHARCALSMLELLLDRLPRLGLIRETYQMVRLVRAMEQNGPMEGRKVSEFDRLFKIGLRSVVETLLTSAQSWDEAETDPAPFTEILRTIADSFLTVWIAHSHTLRLSILEAVTSEADWTQLQDFIKKYGRQLLTASFLQFANLRAISHRGVSVWLDNMLETGEGPAKLIEDLEKKKLSRARVETMLEVVVQGIMEHYEEYRDFNTTSTQSDYGENLHVLLNFLRLKMKYERYAWRMKPLTMAHDVLCRRGHWEIAERWRDNIADFSKDLNRDLLEELAKVESDSGVKLRTVRDRLEERFLQPLYQDRVCALVETVAREARLGADETSPTFAKMTEYLIPLTKNPGGVGLDTPEWLRRLENELERVRELMDSPAQLPDPLVRLSLAQLQQQMREWEGDGE